MGGRDRSPSFRAPLLTGDGRSRTRESVRSMEAGSDPEMPRSAAPNGPPAGDTPLERFPPPPARPLTSARCTAARSSIEKDTTLSTPGQPGAPSFFSRGAIAPRTRGGLDQSIRPNPVTLIRPRLERRGHGMAQPVRGNKSRSVSGGGIGKVIDIERHQAYTRGSGPLYHGVTGPPDARRPQRNTFGWWERNHTFPSGCGLDSDRGAVRGELRRRRWDETFCECFRQAAVGYDFGEPSPREPGSPCEAPPVDASLLDFRPRNRSRHGGSHQSHGGARKFPRDQRA